MCKGIDIIIVVFHGVFIFPRLGLAHVHEGLLQLSPPLSCEFPWSVFGIEFLLDGIPLIPFGARRSYRVDLLIRL